MLRDVYAFLYSAMFISAFDLENLYTEGFRSHSAEVGVQFPNLFQPLLAWIVDRPKNPQWV